MGNTYFSKSVSTLGSRRKWVYSLWVKRQKITDTQSILMGLEDGSNYTKCQFNGTDRIEFTNVYGGGTTGQKITEAQYLDTNACYHVYLVWNTLDPATADDRMQIWVNGVRCTDFNSSSNPGATTESAWNANPTDHYIGANDAGSNHLWGGYMAQVCSIDGTTPAVTVFGSFDATSGEWKPKSDGELRSGITFGTNGYLLPFSNASNLGYDYQSSDRSGTTNDWTLVGDGLQSQIILVIIFLKLVWIICLMMTLPFILIKQVSMFRVKHQLLLILEEQVRLVWQKENGIMKLKVSQVGMEVPLEFLLTLLMMQKMRILWLYYPVSYTHLTLPTKA